MITDETAKELHDRATRGETLSAAERAELEAWYARQDAEEMALLAGAPSPGDLAALRAQVDEAHKQLLIVSERIRVRAGERQGQRLAAVPGQQAEDAAEQAVTESHPVAGRKGEAARST